MWSVFVELGLFVVFVFVGEGSILETGLGVLSGLGSSRGKR